LIFTADPSGWERLLSIPVEQRLAPAPPVLVDFVAQCNAADGTGCVPVSCDAPPDFVLDLGQAIRDLPETVSEKLAPCLLGVFFMRGIGASAVTDVVARADGGQIGSFIAIDLDVLESRRANDWASWKENTPFLPHPDVSLDIRIAEPAEDTRKTALQYLLLHEFGHVLTAVGGFLPEWWLDAKGIAASEKRQFLDLSWQVDGNGKILPAPHEDFPLRDQVVYYSRPKLPASDIPVLYTALEKTSFVTLYAATNAYDDFAECFASYVHQILLGRCHVQSVCKNGESILQTGDFWNSPRSRRKAEFLAALLAAPPNQPLATFLEQHDMTTSATPFLGLAPFLRASISGADLRPAAQGMLVRAQQELENANLWMNLATAFFALQQREMGLNIQGQALQMQAMYHLPATRQPAKFRLLVLLAPGDLAENTPIDCLLEDGSVDLIYYYVSPAAPLPAPLPEHDALLVAISDTDDSRPLIELITPLLRDWPKPVINAPHCVSNTERSRASELLQGVPGLLMPPTRQVTRQALQAVARGEQSLDTVFAGGVFPVILRPVGSHAGRDLDKIDNAAALADYLSRIADAAFFISRFIDYSGPDGLFRIFRVALVGGQPFACHMAISSHWMIHYVNAGMYEDAGKRAEEAAFMTGFASFAKKHATALEAVYRRSGLDYVCIDCAETRDGDLLIFEIDHAMVVHAMDPEDLFPYKQTHMLKVRTAFENFLFSLPSAT
jgi:hypothetical protein